jgi:hypothetical protein
VLPRCERAQSPSLPPSGHESLPVEAMATTHPGVSADSVHGIHGIQCNTKLRGIVPLVFMREWLAFAAFSRIGLGIRSIITTGRS